jgi:hypothetical protein
VEAVSADDTPLLLHGFACTTGASEDGSAKTVLEAAASGAGLHLARLHLEEQNAAEQTNVETSAE